MVSDCVLEEVEPEERELGENSAFIRDTAREHMVEGGDAIRGDEKKLVFTERVDIANLAARGEGERAEISFEKSRVHHSLTVSLVLPLPEPSGGAACDRSPGASR